MGHQCQAYESWLAFPSPLGTAGQLPEDSDSQWPGPGVSEGRGGMGFRLSLLHGCVYTLPRRHTQSFRCPVAISESQSPSPTHSLWQGQPSLRPAETDSGPACSPMVKQPERKKKKNCSCLCSQVKGHIGCGWTLNIPKQCLPSSAT